MDDQVLIHKSGDIAFDQQANRNKQKRHNLYSGQEAIHSGLEKWECSQEVLTI